MQGHSVRHKTVWYFAWNVKHAGDKSTDESVEKLDGHQGRRS